MSTEEPVELSEVGVDGLDPLVVDDLRIDPQLAANGVIRCAWTGKSTHRYPSRVLTPYFDRLIAVAESRRAPIEMSFEKLLHFNSSTIGAIVQLIQQTRSRGMKLTLSYSGEQRWQRVSFEALRVFDKGDGTFALQMV